MARKKDSPIRRLLNPWRLAAVAVIGVAVAVWLLYSDVQTIDWKLVQWGGATAAWLCVALLMMGIRDLAYMYRLRVLTGYELSWKRSFQTIFLWEFASSITPSVVGGAPIAIFLVNQEGINLGRSTTIVLITSLLDELFFVVMVPILYFALSSSELFASTMEQLPFLGKATGVELIFWSSYGLIVLYSCFISFGIFVRPQAIRSLLLALFSLPFLRQWKKVPQPGGSAPQEDSEASRFALRMQRWRNGFVRTGDEIVVASAEVRQWPFSHWVKAVVATFFSWTARYWVVNFLIVAFAAVTFGDHLLIYGRQLVMWIILLISPTPGGTGVAEVAFKVYLHQFLPDGFSGILAVLWRVISYYPYIFIGLSLLPRWITRVYLKRRLIRFKD